MREWKYGRGKPAVIRDETCKNPEAVEINKKV